MVACDRFLRVDTRSTYVTLRSAELLKGKVTKLTLQLPEGWVYQAGMYVMINCNLVNDEEWHPFTLTSAPEQNILSVHIRCPDELDWCSALRRRLVEDPARTVSRNEIDIAKTHRIRVNYSPYTTLSVANNRAEKVGGYARPWRIEVIDDDGKTQKEYKVDQKEQAKNDQESLWPARDEEGESDTLNLMRNRSQMSLGDLVNPTIPDDVVRIGVDGPFGAPSELVWHHRVCVLVGAGIGVTPFASILRSIVMRQPTKKEIEKGLAKAKQRRESLGRGQAGAPDILEWKPCQHVHFYWLCRGQDEFNWFADLLQSSVEGATENIEINLYQTGEVELSKVKNLGSCFRQFMGRPSWNRIFPAMAKQYPGEHIGVFLCGAAAIRKGLAEGCAKGNKNDVQTMFSLNAENF